MTALRLEAVLVRDVIHQVRLPIGTHVRVGSAYSDRFVISVGIAELRILIQLDAVAGLNAENII